MTSQEPHSDVLPAREAITPRDVGLWVAIGLCTVLAIVVVATLAGGFLVRGSVACEACHTMRPYVEAAEESAHASIECAQCHASPGVLGIPVDGLRAIAWIGGGTPASSRVDNSACLRCHGAVREGVLESRGIAVRHSDFLEVPCVDCHAGTGILSVIA